MAGSGVRHAKRNGERMNAVAAVDVELAIAGLLRRAPADAGAGDHCAALADRLCQCQAGLAHCLFGRDNSKLRKAVHEVDVFGGYMVFGDKILDVRRVFEAELVKVGGLDRPDAAFAGDERAPECIAGKADRADDANASDDYAGHV
jgi:hypothetical protein